MTVRRFEWVRRVDSRRTITAHRDRSVNRIAVLKNRVSCVDKPLTAAHDPHAIRNSGVEAAQMRIG